MVTYEEAKRIAGGWLADITGCREYADAYEFFNPRSEFSIGGTDSPVFIMKDSGEKLTPAVYYDRPGAGVFIREFLG